jgi:hypothetical protein
MHGPQLSRLRCYLLRRRCLWIWPLGGSTRTSRHPAVAHYRPCWHATAANPAFKVSESGPHRRCHMQQCGQAADTRLPGLLFSNGISARRLATACPGIRPLMCRGLPRTRTAQPCAWASAADAAAACPSEPGWTAQQDRGASSGALWNPSRCCKLVRVRVWAC